MKWAKSSEPLKAKFAAALPDGPDVERRQMFGYPAAFVNGNMLGGLWQEHVILRLADGDRARLGGKPFEPMAGRPMREYVVVPPATVENAVALRTWIDKAFQYTATLPVKKKKAPKARRAKAKSK